MRLGTGREPILTYRMAPRDLARLRRSITILAEMAFAGGAREVYLPIFGTSAIDSLDEVKKLESEPLDARRIECLAFHPLGSARMATDARRGVVDPSGQSYEVEDLYVADGSDSSDEHRRELPAAHHVDGHPPGLAARRQAAPPSEQLTAKTD